ncbi:MAG: hypothetical protein OEU26_37115 [Candidatus Tectomicrobia bacterium]|nr:hypothetical protein [Candidatus Tectomicrobia bacterium]
MSTEVKNYFEEKMVWKPSSSSIYPYIGNLGGVQCLIRLNDFPDDYLYTLIVDDREIASFDDWPQHWIRP